jgi:hypothetical protein
MTDVIRIGDKRRLLDPRHPALIMGPMRVPPKEETGGSRPPPAGEGGHPPLTALRRRLTVLRRVVPGALLLVVLVYEFGVARWIQGAYGDQTHFLVETALYGTVGPALAYGLLLMLGRWLEERETSDLQAAILAEARERARVRLQITDHALQALFAANALLFTLEASETNLSEGKRASLGEARRALERSIEELNRRLSVELRPAGEDVEAGAGE